MTNRFFQIQLFCLLLSSSLLFAEGLRIEVRSAAFFHSDKLFREIYGKTGVDFQIQASTEWSCPFELWSNIAWFSRKGHSVGFHDPTRAHILNYSFGINFLYPLDCQCMLYAGAGPCIGRIWLNNDSRFNCKDRETKVALGAIIKSGLYYTFRDCLYFDLFLDYIYQPVHFKRNHIDIGGIKTGVGIGTLF